ncbi:MAG: apolipoprotein N-acyltransferase [bacterium]|nr:apolipoprotein N-acyltransferase [bacterium]
MSLLTSILLLLSFYCAPFVVFVSFIPLIFVSYKSNNAFKYGFISGFVFSVGLLYWILVLEVPFRVWLWAGVLLLFIYFGLIFGFSAWFSNRIRSFIFIPIAWTSVEFIRSLSPELGFPWGSVGYALTHYLQFVQFAEFIGLPGITFFVLLINSLIFYTMVSRKLRYLYGAAIVVCIVWLQGRLALDQKESAPEVRIGVIQPNVVPEIKREEDSFDYRLLLLYKLSEKVGTCDLLVWPETAIPGYLNLNDLGQKVFKIVDSLNIPVIMGGMRLELSEKQAKTYNSCFLVVPKYRVKGFYDKIYLVPFGERLPFDEIFTGLQRLNFGQGNFSPGKNYKVFELPKFKFSVLICFESIFPRISRKFVRNGAQVLVNITEDSWFGRTAGPYQHAQQAVLRAVEYRIPVVRCGNTGISYFVTPKGEVKEITKIFTQQIIIRDIPLRKNLTFYARWGDWFAWLCVGLLFLLINLRFMSKK